MTRRYDHFFSGREVKPASGRYIDRRSPATGEVVASFAEGTHSDASDAIAAARKAFDEGPWPRMTGAERGNIMFRFAELIERDLERLARIEMEEVGKPIRFARADIRGAIGMTRFAAGMATQIHGETFTNLGPDRVAFVKREPIGVVGMIIPWNFPADVLAKKLPYAMASGCTCVVKPSEFTSGTALEIAKLAIEAGVPPGVVNVVTGFGDPVGEVLTTSPDVNLVSFTGSTRVGKRIISNSAETIKPVALELGGKSANIVFADADLDAAIDGVLFGIFLNTGQCCVSGSRLLVQDTIADDFMARLVQAAKKLKVGDPSDESTDIGTMIHADHMNKVLGYIRGARDEGADLRLGGEPLDGGGLYLAPTIFDHVDPKMSIFREEVFGPVLSASRFSTMDEAIALANDSAYGLANSVWSSDFNTVMTVSSKVKSGLVWANTTLEVAPQLPFGGVKASGYGVETGAAGVEEFTVSKTVLMNSGKRANIYSL
ncbi:MAG: aldehyde dehydrogenase family protein [Candidatus Kaistia colombiensis]|nr:MAG: aldehyde dehydrogenase family protein [Kaistia sp.]